MQHTRHATFAARRSPSVRATPPAYAGWHSGRRVTLELVVTYVQRACPSLVHHRSFDPECHDCHPESTQESRGSPPSRALKVAPQTTLRMDPECAPNLSIASNFGKVIGHCALETALIPSRGAANGAGQLAADVSLMDPVSIPKQRMVPPTAQTQHSWRPNSLPSVGQLVGQAPSPPLLSSWGADDLRCKPRRYGRRVMRHAFQLTPELATLATTGLSLQIGQPFAQRLI